MEQRTTPRKHMPEYEQKKLICELNQMIQLRGFGGGRYFSISIRNGQDEMWITCGTSFGEFLTPDKLKKVSFRQNWKNKECSEEEAAMTRYHQNIYQGFREAGAVITYVPLYMDTMLGQTQYPVLPELLTYGQDQNIPEDPGQIYREKHFLTAVGAGPHDAYTAMVQEDYKFKKKLYERLTDKEEKMVGEISRKEIEDIVSAVLTNVAVTAAQTPDSIQERPVRPNSIYGASGRPKTAETIPGNTGLKGVFTQVQDAVKAADEAQKKFVKEYKMEDRERMIAMVRKYALEKKEELAARNIEETKLGRYDDKVAKIELVVTKTPGTEILTTYAKSGDDGLMIEELGPYGVIGAVSPVTNPTETLICNAIGMLASGNSAVYNVHPSGKKVSAFTVDLINQAVVDAGGPKNLITMVETPTMDTLQEIIKSPEVKLLCGTGGPGLVKTLLSSGKKAIGAGAGNPPVIVDETADLQLAAREIMKGASFENNILCIAEKEVFVLDSVADEFICQMVRQGAYMLSRQEAEKVKGFALLEDEKMVSCGCSGPVTGTYHINKKWVGQDASLFLKELGVTDQKDTRLLIFETDFQNPFVQLEQMMPVLPIVRVKSLEEAMELAEEAEHGNRHTASMFSENVSHLTEFAKRIGTTIFVKNACTMAGVGFGGEGYTTFTIAGPTGEGITSAKTFTRVRRCVLAEGGFHIV